MDAFYCADCKATSDGRFCGYCGKPTQPKPAQTQPQTFSRPVSSPSSGKISRYWTVFVKNVPQEVGKPALLLSQGQLAWKSDGSSNHPASGKVEVDVSEDYGVHADYTFELQIPSMGYEVTKTFNTGEGLSLLFEFQSGTLALSVVQARSNSQLTR